MYAKSFCSLVCIGLFVWGVNANAIPKIQHWQTENGAKVYFVEAHELPMVDIEVVFDAGSARDDAHPGIAAFVNGLLDQGAGQWNADTLAEGVARLGARLGNESGRDMATVSLRSLSAPPTLLAAGDFFAAVLSKPTFPQDAYERERSRTLTGIEEEEQSPASVASKAFYRVAYGDHPYAHSPLGTRESLTAMTRQDLLDFYRRYYVGRNAVVALVGDLSRSGAESLVFRVVGELPSGETPAPLPVVKNLSKGMEEALPFPSAQTHVMSGQPVVYRGDPDYFPLYLGNHILGGNGLISRIADEVREKRGLAYSAYSQFSPMRLAGPFVMGLQTRNDQSEEARRVLQQTLEKFVQEGPSQKELQEAQKNVSGGFALRIDSNGKILGYLGMIGFYNLSLEYLNQFRSNIESVTVDQIREAFQRRLNPAYLATVVVGGSVKNVSPNPELITGH